MNKQLLTNFSDITPEMIKFYKIRTHLHIQKVQKYGNYLKKFLNNSQRIILSSYLNDHDKSKFTAEELNPYILFTWFKKHEDKYEMSSELQNKFKISCNHHYKHNSHHPEHYKNLNNMNVISMTEMVADWAAMSDEFNNSIINWYEQCMEKYNFSKEQEIFIAQLTYYADQCLKKEVKNYKSR